MQSNNISNGNVHPFNPPDLDQTMARSTVTEIAPDVWCLEGLLGVSFFIAPPSGNIFILRDRDLVLLLDTGTYPFYRPRMLEILKRYKQQGAKKLVLMVSQGHWDHVLNNDIILEAGYEEVRFLLPEPEVPTIEVPQHWLGDFAKMEYYYNPYNEEWLTPLKELEQYARGFEAYSDPNYQELWKIIQNATPQTDYREHRKAMRLFMDHLGWKGIRNMAEMADVLPLSSRERRTFGDVECMGWQVGRFFVIHDGSHSPGHICVYDPLNKLILTGDASVEINPAFFDSSLAGCIDINRKFRHMAEQGFIQTATDGHRNSLMADGFTFMQYTPLGPLECKDVMNGTDQCASFFRMFEEFYSFLRDETLAAHRRLGEATVEEICDELFKSTHPALALKKALLLPNRKGLLVAKVLEENGFASRRVDGGRILFTPPAPFKF